MKKTSTLAITIALIGSVWALAVVAYTTMFELPGSCWGSIICTVVAIMSAEIYLLGFKKDSGESETEYGALGIIFTVVFLLIAVLLNSVFLLLGCGDFNWWLLTANLLTIACYVILLLWSEQTSARLAQQTEKIEQKSVPATNIGRKLGELLAITEDAEIRARLLKLKETVDHSTNISIQATGEREALMEVLLDELAQLTIAHAERLIILNKVEAAETIWKMRNSAASYAR